MTQVTVAIGRRIYVWLLVMSFVSPMGVAVAGFVYTGYNQHQADKRWCRLFADLDQARAMSPTTDPEERRRSEMFRERIHDLRVEHGCIDE